MEIQFILHRVKNMIIAPSAEWEKIAAEDTDHVDIVKNFVLPIVVISAIAKFLGLFLFSGTFLFVHSLVQSVSHFISVFAGFYLTSLFVLQVAPSFAPQIDKNTSFKYIAYSLIPYFASTILSNLFQSLLFLQLFYLYSIFLLWQGLDSLLKTPDSKKLGFIAVVILVLFLLILAIDETIEMIIPL